MAPIFRNALICAAAVSAALCFATVTPASAIVYDLKTDWSDAINPNGQWAYRENSTNLIQHPNWQSFGPAWSNGTAGTTTPMLLKYDGVGSEGIDASTGDIVGHTANSGTNLNIVFTTPAAGTADISGSVWDAHLTVSRTMVWELLINGVQQSTGIVAGDGTNGSSAPDPFSLLSVVLAANDVIELRSYKQTGQDFGGLLGFSLTIDLTPDVASAVPLPGALPLFGTVVAGFLGFQGWRRRRQAVAKA